MKSNQIEHSFKAEQVEELIGVLKGRQVMPSEEVETVVHALVDILESVEKVYAGLIPKILACQNTEKEMVTELIEDIREEFRHIDYHIHDAKLTDL